MQGELNTYVVPGSLNHIELIVTRDTATLAINQTPVANLQLAMPATPGEFRLMNGLHPTQKSVNSMPFENFIIWQPEYSD